MAPARGLVRVAAVARRLVLAAVTGVVALLGFGSPPSTTPTIEQRSAEVRARLADRTPESTQLGAQPGAVPADPAAAQWGNWGNWGNWLNFANWNNWGNWLNWYNA
jgi:hypothetical protein